MQKSKAECVLWAKQNGGWKPIAKGVAWDMMQKASELDQRGVETRIEQPHKTLNQIVKDGEWDG